MPGFNDEGYVQRDTDYQQDEGYYQQGEPYHQQDAYYQQDPYYQPGGDRYQDEEPRPARRRKGPLRRLAPWVAVAIILAPIAYGGWWGYHFYENKYHPADYSGSGTGTVKVLVKQGDTAFSLAPELVSLGVVASARAFELAAEHSTNPSGLVPGEYRLHSHMQANLAYAALLDQHNLIADKITLPEGLRLNDILTRLAQSTSIARADYQRALGNPALGLPSYARGKAEGYLFPATYQISPSATALSVLQQMVASFKAEASATDLVTAAGKVNLSPSEAVVVASLVQAEGGSVSDFPKIARVIYNRLNQHMNLDLDSTVLYGLNTYGILASNAQLQSNSPYNTYRHAGLPPGPIDSPGVAAIEAALHPAAGNWLYFVTVNPKTGLTKFTASYAEFQQFERELRQNLGQG